MELRLHFDVSVDDGGRGVRCEAQEILDPGAIHIHVEGDVVADAVQASIVACLQNAHDRPLAVKCELFRVASTGSSHVSPLVPSTRA